MFNRFCKKIGDTDLSLNPLRVLAISAAKRAIKKVVVGYYSRYEKIGQKRS
jgi:hypothetical protein